jgi:4-hydroxy-2-oxoheptanedioate aldolase
VNHPINRFKQGLRANQPQIGLWASLSSHYATEVIAGAGFDWILIDTEHSPNDPPMVHMQLQAMMESQTTPIVRVPWNDLVTLKRILDIGAQTVLIPFVQNAEEAARAVAACRYPPQGIRGVATTVRANRFGRIKNYHQNANEQICVLVQVETRSALKELDAIAATPGIDGVFIGPQDLAADFGHLTNPSHPEVQAAIADAVNRIRAAGKAAGIVMASEVDARKWLDAGCMFVAVGSDMGLLARGSEALLAKFKGKD